MNGAWNLVHGRGIYRDFFEFIGPGSFEWVGLFFKVLGPSYGTALLASWVLLVASLWAYHALARDLIRHRGAARAASLLWLLASASPPFVNHNSYSSFLAVFFSLLLVRTARAKGRLRTGPSGGGGPFLAGAVATLTFFVLQPKGLVLLVLGLGFLLLAGRLGPAEPEAGGPAATDQTRTPGWGGGEWARTRKEGVTLYLAGAVVLGGLGAARWGWNPISALLVVAHGTVEMNHLALSYLPLLGALGVTALVAVASYRERLLDREGVFLLLLQLGLWASSAHLPDPWHLWINSFPLILMVGRLAELVLGRASSRPRRRLVELLFVVVTVGGGVRLITQNVQETRRTGVWLREVGSVVGEEEFYSYTFLPSFYLELGVENPYFNSVLFTGAHPPDHFRRNVEILSERRPRFILLDYASVRKYGHSLENPMDEFIRRHYSRAWTLPHGKGELEIWERTGGG